MLKKCTKPTIYGGYIHFFNVRSVYLSKFGTSGEKPTTAVILLQKDNKMETANVQNSTRPISKPLGSKRAIFCPRTYDDNATIKLNLADIKNFKY